MAQAALVERETSHVASATTPMEMLATVAANGGSLEVVEKFMALAERWEKNQARKSFDAAISEAKAKIPVIAKNATGHNSKRYADFAEIARTIDPILADHGLSYRFRTSQDDRINVTCIISHKDGHCEETTLAGPADGSGSKNAIQAIGSTLTYLQRYSLMQVLGLAASEDDDGQRGGTGALVSAEQAKEIQKLIEAFDLDKPFKKFFKVDSVEELPASLYQRAIDELNAIGASARGVKA